MRLGSGQGRVLKVAAFDGSPRLNQSSWEFCGLPYLRVSSEDYETAQNGILAIINITLRPLEGAVPKNQKIPIFEAFQPSSSCRKKWKGQFSLIFGLKALCSQQIALRPKRDPAHVPFSKKRFSKPYRPYSKKSTCLETRFFSENKSQAVEHRLPQSNMDQGSRISTQKK